MKRPLKNQTYVDLHCHPILKPFGQSFDKNINSKDYQTKNSIWHQNSPGIKTKFLNITSTLTKFTQSDLKTLVEGKVLVISAALSPIEKGFFISRYGSGKAVNLVSNLISGIGKNKVNFIQSNTNYFHELINEYDFFKQLDGKIIKIEKENYQYIIANTYNEIENNLKNKQVNTVSVVLSIEGAHVFNVNNNQPINKSEILNNVLAVKNWDHRVLFISLAHHFYNEISGHCYSLGNRLKQLLNQDYGVDSGLTLIGKEVLDLLLDKSKGQRILIDIKHFSRKARREYYELLKTSKYKKQNIPIIASHAAVNGYPTVYSDDKCDEDNGKFYGLDVNFFDDEIVKIAESNGLFCLQLDERRAASKSARKMPFLKSLIKRNVLKHRAELIWNQIEHVASVLDKAGLNAWDSMAIGSDSDGIIDPLNGYWTSKEFGLLKKYLNKFANEFIFSGNSLNHNNQIQADELLDKIFSENAMKFLKDNL